MFCSKRAIAGIIVCFKPHVFLTLSILIVIFHSVFIAIQRGATGRWPQVSLEQHQYDITPTMLTVILALALLWALFFVFIIRYELRNELETLLILFQCSKRGLRFLGVVFFHIGLLALVGLLVSSAVERSVGDNISISRNRVDGDCQDKVYISHVDLSVGYLKDRGIPVRYQYYNNSCSRGSDKVYLATIYKIWLTAIVYAFLYLIIENMVMFYTDLSLIEFVHGSFLHSIAKITGIDLSDYPAGEMLFNPLVRRRIR